MKRFITYILFLFALFVTGTVILVLIKSVYKAFDPYQYCRNLEEDCRCSIDFSHKSENYDLANAQSEYRKKNYPVALAVVDKFIVLHAEAGKKMQNSLRESPWEKEKILSYSDLNDMSLALLIKGSCLKKLGRVEEAVNVYKELIEDFSWGQCLSHGQFCYPRVAAFGRILEAGFEIEMDKSKMNILLKQRK